MKYHSALFGPEKALLLAAPTTIAAVSSLGSRGERAAALYGTGARGAPQTVPGAMQVRLQLGNVTQPTMVFVTFDTTPAVGVKEVHYGWRTFTYDDNRGEVVSIDW